MKSILLPLMFRYSLYPTKIDYLNVMNIVRRDNSLKATYSKYLTILFSNNDVYKVSKGNYVITKSCKILL